MKFLTFLSALVIVPAALAAPKHGKSCSASKPKPGPSKGDLKDFPFCFTSTYQIIATPDQVVNANNTATPGESGAIGYYNYGIQSDMDLICWVSDLERPLGQFNNYFSISLSKALQDPINHPQKLPRTSTRLTRVGVAPLASHSPIPSPRVLARTRTRFQWDAWSVPSRLASFRKARTQGQDLQSSKLRRTRPTSSRMRIPPVLLPGLFVAKWTSEDLAHSHSISMF